MRPIETIVGAVTAGLRDASRRITERTASTPHEHTVSTEHVDRIRIRMRDGALSISPRASGQLEISEQWPIDPRRLARHTSARVSALKVEQFGRTLYIDDLRLIAGSGVHGLGLRLEIRAPRDAGLEIDLATGELTVSGEVGTLDAKVAAGGVELRGLSCSGDHVRVELATGEAIACFVRLPPSGAEIRVATGQAAIQVADGAPATLALDVTTGGISSDLPLQSERRRLGARARAEIDGGGPPLKVHVDIGSIRYEPWMPREARRLVRPAMPDGSDLLRPAFDRDAPDTGHLVRAVDGDETGSLELERAEAAPGRQDARPAAARVQDQRPDAP